MTKLSAAKIRANKKWESKNKERRQYLNKRSAAKSFILKLATEEDLDNLADFIQQRRADLEKKSE
jgi:hypothetical protein